MELTTETSVRGQTILAKRTDWPAWFAQLKFFCLDKDIWDQVNPESPVALTDKEREPTFLTLLAKLGLKPT